MNNVIQLSTNDGVAVVTINNPPVNALGDQVRETLRETFEQFDQDAGVKAIVLIGSGSTFVVGADINKFGEFTSGRVKRTPALLSALLKVEDCSKPVVCAIHGNAFGAGLETAMACHYRVAAPGAKIGQPEVNLGLIPGAGGTQRLPRLAGVAKAIEMCSQGKPIKVEEGLQLGIIDKIMEGDLLAGAVAFAREIAGKQAPKTRERNEKLGTPEENEPIFAAAHAEASKKQRGLPAPHAAIDAVAAATKLPFDEGCAEEQRLFSECLFSDASKALIHGFFASAQFPRSRTCPGRRRRFQSRKSALSAPAPWAAESLWLS